MSVLCFSHVSASLLDGSVGQLLLLAHHWHFGGLAEAPELYLKGRGVDWAGRGAFRGTVCDG